MENTDPDFYFPPHVGPSKEERINFLQNEIQRWRVNPPKREIPEGPANAPLGAQLQEPPTAEDAIERLTISLHRLMESEG